MAKWEIHKRLSIPDAIWWRWMPGVEVSVKWPAGNIIVDHNDPRWVDIGGAVWVDLGFSADPNDHYRWWLEKYVGRQGWDWNWKIGRIDDRNGDTLVIKVRQKHAKYVTIMAMMWN